MKQLILYGFIFSVTVYADLSVAQIEMMVNKIHEKREGANLAILDQTKEPFIKLKEEDNITVVVLPDETPEERISLHAVMNGKAYINDGWVSLDENILGYTLKYIGKRGVVLRNGNHIKRLFLHDKKNDFITIEGR